VHIRRHSPLTPNLSLPMFQLSALYNSLLITRKYPRWGQNREVNFVVYFLIARLKVMINVWLNIQVRLKF